MTHTYTLTEGAKSHDSYIHTYRVSRKLWLIYTHLKKKHKGTHSYTHTSRGSTKLHHLHCMCVTCGISMSSASYTHKVCVLHIHALISMSGASNTRAVLHIHIDRLEGAHTYLYEHSFTYLHTHY